MAGSCFNAFASFGAFRFSSRQTYGEMFYRQFIEAQQVKGADGAFDSSWNTYNSCRLYAIAMALQTCQLQLDHAFNQRDPRCCTEKLPELEADYQIVPLPTATIADRRIALQAAMNLREGNLDSVIDAGLSTILGLLYTGSRSLTPTEAPAYLIGQSTLKSFDRFGTDYKLVRTTGNISATGSQTVSYVQLGGSGKSLEIDDKLTFDVTCNGRTEVVTLTGATSSTLTAVFAHGHDSGAIATTQQWPAWVSLKRHILVFVYPAVLNNADLLRKANNFLDYALRGSSTWSIVPGAIGSTIPYTIETSRTDQNTIEAMSI